MYNIIRGGEGTDSNFYYDDWGRMISKDQGAYGANYEYRYGDKLYSVTSNFPGEGTVEYHYGSDGKRRTRETATSYTWYNWAGWNVINEEDSGNVLDRTYVHGPGNAVGRILAHADGASLGNVRYYLEDILGTTRGLHYHNRGYAAGTRYAPYGDVQNQTGSWNTTYMFTGQDWDADAQMYYFPFRYYSPGTGRWTTRDPLGGTNLYAYVMGNPVNYIDPLGLYYYPVHTGPAGLEPTSGYVTEHYCQAGEVGGVAVNHDAGTYVAACFSTPPAPPAPPQPPPPPGEQQCGGEWGGWPVVRIVLEHGLTGALSYYGGPGIVLAIPLGAANPEYLETGLAVQERRRMEDYWWEELDL